MATTGRPAFSDAKQSNADELIVATEHVAFVRDLIASRITKETESHRLGLTRLRLQTDNAVEDLNKAIKRTRGAREVRAALLGQAAALAKVVDVEPPRDDVIATIASDLRALAAAQHGGWMPTIGRNRLVELPGSGSLGVTSKTSYGVSARAAGSKTSYGGGGMPRAITDRWTPPIERASGPGRGVRVGLVDTRIWPHPWLSGGWQARPSDLLPDGPRQGLAAGHGTFVAGLILSQAPGATIEVRSALADDGQGYAWDAAEAIAELGQSGVSVINLSFTCHTGDGQAPLVLARAVDRVDSDVIVVAAAGNHAGLGRVPGAKSKGLARFAAMPAWPGALDDVVTVGAVDGGRQTADFSPERPWVDVATRGVDVRSTYLPEAMDGTDRLSFEDGWAEWSGTSFAAALVSGAIAAGIDPGRVSGSDVVGNLWSTTAGGSNSHGLVHDRREPRVLNLRTAGWARESKTAQG